MSALQTRYSGAIEQVIGGARESGFRVSPNTVARFENGHHTPNPAKVIRQAFEAAGVRFTDRGVEPPEAKRND
jgi:hypothetical protein